MQLDAEEDGAPFGSPKPPVGVVAAPSSRPTTASGRDTEADDADHSRNRDAADQESESSTLVSATAAAQAASAADGSDTE